MIPQKIRTLRQAKGLTLKELADKTQTTAGYISQLERGLVDPSLSTLRKIAAVLDTGRTDRDHCRRKFLFSSKWGLHLSQGKYSPQYLQSGAQARRLHFRNDTFCFCQHGSSVNEILYPSFIRQHCHFPCLRNFLHRFPDPEYHSVYRCPLDFQILP